MILKHTHFYPTSITKNKMLMHKAALFAAFLTISTSNALSTNMAPNKIEDVVIAIAMEAEAQPLIDRLSLKPNQEFFNSPISSGTAPFLAYQGKHESCNITIVTNGKDAVHGTGVDNVGTIPAALATYLALDKLNSNPDKKVDLLINAGTCGGFKKMGAEIGDVYLTTAVANHDRRINIPGSGFEEYGIGKVESTTVSSLAKEINAKLGVCTTGNSLDAHDVDHKLMQENEASVKDMEAAAIAWSCEMHQTPHFGIKVVTDIVDGDKPSHEEFMENLGTAAQSLQGALPKVIEYICGKGHDEL